MPTVTLAPEADVGTWISPAYGAGAGLHLPIGYWGSAKYRSAIRFPLPAGWAGWTAINKATLSISISDFQHVGVANSSIYVRRMGVTPWTKGEGSQNCESGFSGSNNTQASDLGPSSADQVTFASGTTANARKSIVVTGIVSFYWVSGSAKIVFVFDPVGTGDYTELWSQDKGGGYVASLLIDYTVASPPNAPTPTGPADGAIIDTTLQPVFSWVHNATQGDPQTQADVQLYTSAGVAIGAPQTLAGAGNSLTWATALTPGTTYKWAVRTYDVSGAGAYCAQQTFTIRAAPVVTISATRIMVFANGAPRLVVNWTTDQAQAGYRVTATGYDSGAKTGPAQTQVLDTLALTSGTAVSVTVTVTAATGLALTGSASQSFTPRYGLTTHRRDTGTAPVIAWESATIASTVPAGCDLHMQYGSSPNAGDAAPTSWVDSIGAVPLARYLFWRAWFIPSATAGPTLDRITISVRSGTPSALDKWTNNPDKTTPQLTAPWAVSVGEYVYGSQSATALLAAGALTGVLYSLPIKLKAGRSYILTGLMKAQGNPGAYFRLEQDADGVVPVGGGIYTDGYPAGPMQSPALAATVDWFQQAVHDVVRYRTPVFVCPSEALYRVVLVVNGTAGSQAWFDAVKLEESSVATPWTPGAVGASIVDAGGVQVDGSKGGVIRYRGSAYDPNTNPRAVVAGGPNALLWAGDTELTSPSTGVLAINGASIGAGLQPLDSDLTAIAGLTPADLDIIQRRGAAWANRTLAQLLSDLGIQWGTVGVPMGNTTAATAPVTFARGYTVAPVVIVTAVWASGLSNPAASLQGTSSTSGFTVRMLNGVATAATIVAHWIAIGTPA